MTVSRHLSSITPIDAHIVTMLGPIDQPTSDDEDLDEADPEYERWRILPNDSFFLTSSQLEALPERQKCGSHPQHDEETDGSQHDDDGSQDDAGGSPHGNNQTQQSQQHNEGQRKEDDDAQIHQTPVDKAATRRKASDSLHPAFLINLRYSDCP